MKIYVSASSQEIAATTVLRKLLEADEALGRAIALHVVLEAASDLNPPPTNEAAP